VCLPDIYFSSDQALHIIHYALAENDWARSSRLILLVKTVRSIVKAGERFVIVADRIFLLTFIYWVSPSESVFKADVVCRFYIKKDKLNMGILAGQKIFDQRSETKERDDVVSKLNDSKSGMHGVLNSEKVGACGLNLVGASHIIFLGSLYSQDFENQAIGTNPPCGADPTLY
jgi:hypothetical protein